MQCAAEPTGRFSTGEAGNAASFAPAKTIHPPPQSSPDLAGRICYWGVIGLLQLLVAMTLLEAPHAVILRPQSSGTFRNVKFAILLFTVMVCCGAPSASQDHAQSPGYWVDPATGLVWAAKDNGKDVNWKQARKYCRDLRLADHSDWRLATLDELKGIFSKNSNAPGRSFREDFTWHVKGSLFLTGDAWSSNWIADDRGRPSGYEWYFNFNEGRSNSEPSGWPYSSSGMRALCVRSPGS